MSVISRFFWFCLALAPALASADAVPREGRELRWIDGRDVPLEGRPFDDAPGYYTRLPAVAYSQPELKKILTAARFPSGMCFRFKTSSTSITVEWTLESVNRYAWNVAPCADCGVDVYRWFEGRGWWYVATGGRPKDGSTGRVTVPWSPGAQCMVYLPIGARVRSVRFGIDAGAEIEPLGPRAGGITRPVVFYGTSMVHGYCSSRPGMTWPAILSRRMDFPFVNQGYNGHGELEPPMAGHLADIDASAYCFLTLGGNMTLAEAEERFPKFLKELHSRRPSVPILLGEYYYVYGLDYGDGNPKNDYIARLVDSLRREDPAFWSNLYIVKMSDMFVADGDGTADRVHVNDRGAWQIADAFGRVLAKALGVAFPDERSARE